jgi:hypothetical protein
MSTRGDLCGGGMGISSSTGFLSVESGLSSIEPVEIDFDMDVDEVLNGIDFSCCENSDLRGLALFVELILPLKSR